mmetsp:Transcript_16116/g.12915  ORF Transcript_16116/g.12915 Transcript_16116/m.12915 type:complete len:94 (-) Transcript_16116:245-526(-)
MDDARQLEKEREAALEACRGSGGDSSFMADGDDPKEEEPKAVEVVVPGKSRRQSVHSAPQQAEKPPEKTAAELAALQKEKERELECIRASNGS